jgi:hypothetical protein
MKEVKIKKIKISVFMEVPKTDCLAIEEIGEELHAVLDCYGQIYGIHYKDLDSDIE